MRSRQLRRHAGVTRWRRCGGASRWHVDRRPFEPILNANIRGVYNLYEGVRQKGVKRVVFASSNHVVGFHKQTDRLDATAPMRPDGNYGVSKAFGELLSRFYYDRYGVETVCMRIGSSSYPKALDHRMLSTWLSYDDLTELIRCAIFAPMSATVVCAASDNRPRGGTTARRRISAGRRKIRRTVPRRNGNQRAATACRRPCCDVSGAVRQVRPLPRRPDSWLLLS